MIRIAAITGLLVLAVAGCSSEAPTPAAPLSPPLAPVKLMTLVASVGSGGNTSTVTYTCTDGSTAVKVCGPQVIEGVWTSKVAYPVGTVVRMQVQGGMAFNQCSISDESGHLVYNEDRTGGRCTATVD